MALETHFFRDPRNRRFLLLAAALGAFALVLAPLHTLSALLSLPIAGAVAYLLCDMASHAVAGRPFVFPSKWGLNTEEERRILAWSDHVLAFACGALTVVGLFAFGELVDCVRHENVWRGEAVGLDWCVPGER